LKSGDLIEPGGGPSDHVYMTETLDAAAWDGELEPGDGPGRIYIVEPTGPITKAPEPRDKKYPGPTKSYHSRDPLRVTGEVTDAQGRPRRLYHGTKADLVPGDLIAAGYSANFGQLDRVANHVYLAGTLDAAIWGAELALGRGPGRIYVVEPTGLIMDDPNLTNTRFPGNPTKSYRSMDPLRVTGEVTDWQGHPPEAIQAMKDGLEKLEQQGVEPMDD
jgi:rifampin ADP-ribosylating transferase